MLKVKTFQVRSLSLYSNELQWELDYTVDDPFKYTFQVLRSESIGGPYETITSTFSDKYYFIDNVLPNVSTWRTFYYKLQITDPDGNSEFVGPAYIVEPENRYALEITRIERLSFKMFAGIRLYVLPVRTFGKRCSCYDEVRNATMRPGCKECYGVGYSGGYLTAIETFGQMGTYTEMTKRVPPDGIEVETSGLQIKLINYPLAKRGDLVINPKTDVKYRIATVTPTRLANCIIHQELMVSILDQNHVAQNIKIQEEDSFRIGEPPMLVNMTTTY